MNFCRVLTLGLAAAALLAAPVAAQDVAADAAVVIPCGIVVGTTPPDRNGNGLPDHCEIQGLPDNRGCYAISHTLKSPAEGQPAFVMQDLETAGTPLLLADEETSAALPLGFDFELYGVRRSELYVASNGFVSFDPSTSSSASPALPSVNAPQSVIAAFWTDLFPPDGGIRYATLGFEPERRFVLEFREVPLKADATKKPTWQLVLHEADDRIEIHYLDAESGSVVALAGIENETGKAGRSWAGPNPIDLEEDAVRFTPTAALLADSDGDTVRDCLDNCPDDDNDAQRDCDGDGRGDACDEDSSDADDDGIVDACDNCPAAPNVEQLDSDGDGAGDECEHCADEGGADTDSDGVCDGFDNCPEVANAWQSDCDVDGAGDGCDDDAIDADGDRVHDGCDNCPAAANPRQSDTDFDLVGDACDDCEGFGASDGDGDLFCDGGDNCPGQANPSQSDCDEDFVGDACDADASDADEDGVDEACDNCPDDANETQDDFDHDGYGDACDDCLTEGTADSDGDLLCDEVDNCPGLSNATQIDCDEDGTGDACDDSVAGQIADVDGDEICGDVDNCPAEANPDQLDANGNAIGDVCSLQGLMDNAGCYGAWDTIAPPDGNEPVYGFVDISMTGKPIACGYDDVSHALPIGFDFAFYGRFYSEAYVSTDGFLTFLPIDYSFPLCSSYGQAFPLADAPNAYVAGLHDCWTPKDGQLFYETVGTAPNRRFIVQFHEIEQTFSPSQEATFQIVLEEGSHTISVHYREGFAGRENDKLAGIENETGKIGLRWGGPGELHLLEESVVYYPMPPLYTDSDSDNVADCLDLCPAVMDAEQSDCDGDGIGDVCDEDTVDTDLDRIADDCDNCPGDSNEEQQNADADDFGDACDACPGEGSLDGDGDTVCNEVDNCAAVANEDQADSDFDGYGNACDRCVGFGDIDFDLDAICDIHDNCPDLFNPDRKDCDGDFVGDACDPDFDDPDGDGIDELCDNCPGLANPDQANADRDRDGDPCDGCDGFGAADVDGDGACDGEDNCWQLANPDQADVDDDDEGDACQDGQPDTEGCYVGTESFLHTADSPDFEWTDISATGTPIAGLTSGGRVTVPLGFDFEFYGVSYSQVFAHRSALLFVDSDDCCFNLNVPSTNPFQPDGFIAVAPTLHPDNDDVRYQTVGEAPNRRFILQYTEVPDSSNVSPRRVSFQIVLVEGSNEVFVEYLDFEAFGQISLAIENERGTVGWRKFYWDNHHLEEVALRFQPTAKLTDDSDGDGLRDCLDNCPAQANPEQVDHDFDGYGDLCDNCEGIGDGDRNNDGHCDDSCPDADNDLACDDHDNCPGVYNREQSDCDRDRVGDACEQDLVDEDADLVSDACDNCIGIFNPDQADEDGDRIADACQPAVKSDDAGCYTSSDTVSYAAGDEPSYVWEDMQDATIVELPQYEYENKVLPIGFDFEFYGRGYSTAYLSPQNFVSFVEGPRFFAYAAGSIPSQARPNALIGALWDGGFGHYGTARYKTFGEAPSRRFVVEYHAVGTQNFRSWWQLVLHESSRDIHVHYREAEAGPYYTVAGIESETGRTGLRWAGPLRIELDEESVHYVPTEAMLSDGDGDGIRDCVDNCIDVANGDQDDDDRDGIGALCECVPGLTGSDPVCGDVNGDCEITATDAFSVLEAAVGLEGCVTSICDYSGDYKVGITDALGVLREAVGLGSLAKCPAATGA